MKLELIGTNFSKRKLAFRQDGVSWELWLGEHTSLARGWATSPAHATKKAAAALKRFQKAVAALKPVTFQEWAD